MIQWSKSCWTEFLWASLWAWTCDIILSLSAGSSVIYHSALPEKKVSIFFSERLSSMLTKTARNLTRIFGVLLVTGMLLPRHHTHYGVMWESTCWPSGQCITSLESKFTPLGKKTFEKLSARPRWDWNFFSKKLRLIWARAVHVKTVLKYWSLTKCSLITCIH